MKSIFTYTVLLILVGGLFSGCSNYVEMPNLKLPEQSIQNSEGISTLSFAMIEPEIVINTAMTRTTTSGLYDRAKQDSNQVGCYLFNEMYKILLSKGFTITDRFQSYENMTYRQKRSTSALFYPQIIINIEEKSQLENFSFLFYSSDKVRGRLLIDATVNIVMLEPLSGEKLWMKTLKINEIDEFVEYEPGHYGGPQLNGTFVPKDLLAIAETIDRLFEDISRNIVDATQRDVKHDGFEFLSEDIKRLKGTKRY